MDNITTTGIEVKPTAGKRFLVTAALPYSNGALHVGHIAGAYLPCDIFVRYLKMCGSEVRAVCGSDDHGVAIMVTAQKEGKTPAEVAKHYNERQQKALEGLGIHFDVYGATSQTKFHTATSQHFFLKLFEKGFFKKKEVQQFYDPSKSMFLPDRFVKGTCAYCGAAEQNGDQCEECGKMLDIDTLQNPKSAMSGQPAVVKKTTHWFLDLSKFEETVESWLKQANVRENTKTYVRGLLSTGLIERSMTRDIDWGIPVPLEDPDAKGKVLYVWFDAPIGYISNTQQLCEKLDDDPEKYAAWWKSKDCEIYHFIGEDNTIFHTVIWIAMLSAEGSFQLPSGVVVNSFLNIKFPDKEVEKMSKSRGTAVWIEEYLAEGNNPDVLRYYLTAIAPESSRTVYRPDDLIARNNNELGNIVGNLVNRVVAFTHKYFGPNIPAYPESKITERDLKLREDMKMAFKEVTSLMNRCSFKAALERIMEFGRECNRYLDDKAPWTTRKTDMELTAATLAEALNGIKMLGVLLSPFLPNTSSKIASMLCYDYKTVSWEEALTPLPKQGSLEKPEILFPRME